MFTGIVAASRNLNNGFPGKKSKRYSTACEKPSMTLTPMFDYKGGGCEPGSLVAKLKERAISVKGKYVWSVLLVNKVVELINNIKEFLKNDASHT